MLDVGFSEILLTSAIALIVLGPEKLPKVARQVGNWMGRARAMARQLSEQLEREVSADELMKAQTKPSARAALPVSSSAPAEFDPSYVPNATPPVSIGPTGTAPASTTAPILASASATAPGVYTPETAATVHGADWHPSPVDPSPPNNKPGNE